MLTLVELVALTERGRTDPGELRAILAKVRAEGFALVGQELADGLTLLAVSIRGHRLGRRGDERLGECTRVDVERLVREFLARLQQSARHIEEGPRGQFGMG